MASPTLQGEKQAILDLMTAGEDNHWQIGQHYNTIVDGGLATAAGYKTSVEFFAHELKQIPQSTLSLYGVVAKTFSEPVAKKYGVSKLGLLVTFESAYHGPAPSGDPGTVMVRVAQKDGTIADKAFKDCTVSDLNDAIKALKAPVQLSQADAKKLSDIQAALDTALGHGKVEVKAHLRGRKVAIQLGTFDLDAAATVADALKAG